MLALAALQVLRRPLPEFLRDEIMEPIGASSTWRWHGYENSWIELDGRRIQSMTGGGHWGGGMFISARDMARFGYLFLRNGKWKDRQIVSQKWIDMARTPGPANTVRLHELVPEHGAKPAFRARRRPAVTFQGNGSNIIYIDWENDLVVVVRWIRQSALNEFIGQVLGALGPSTTVARWILSICSSSAPIPMTSNRSRRHDREARGGGHRVGLCDLTAGEMGSNGTVEERLAEAEAARRCSARLARQPALARSRHRRERRSRSRRRGSSAPRARERSPFPTAPIAIRITSPPAGADRGRLQQRPATLRRGNDRSLEARVGLLLLHQRFRAAVVRRRRVGALRSEAARAACHASQFTVRRPRRVRRG